MQYFTIYEKIINGNNNIYFRKHCALTELWGAFVEKPQKQRGKHDWSC